MADSRYNESQVSSFYGATITLVIAATIAVALRLVSRRLSAAKLWWDDWILVLALFFDYSLSICYWLQVVYGGLGHHTVAFGGPVTDEKVVIYFKLLLALQICYLASAFAIKTSLILLYYRIFRVTRWFRWELMIAFTIVVLYFIVDVLVAAFECQPVAFFWDKKIPGGNCIDEAAFFRWNGVANLVIDFMVLTLTLPLIWGLNLKFRQKLSLSGVFLLGTFACVASIVRVVTFSQIDFTDVTYTAVNASMWSTIEQSIGIICACLITYQPLLGVVFKRKSDDSERQHNASKSFTLSNLRSRPMAKSSGDASVNSFTRLDERDAFENSISTVPHGELPVVSEGIVKSQTIEQHYGHAR